MYIIVINIHYTQENVRLMPSIPDCLGKQLLRTCILQMTVDTVLIHYLLKTRYFHSIQYC